MAEFFITLHEKEIARQVADLLNLYNRLTITHTAQTILSSLSSYFVELDGNRVVGCTALFKQYPTLSKSFHTSVAPTHRGKGLGQKLLMIAMAHCETENIYGTVRQDNFVSLRMLKKLGFVFVREELKNDHYIYIMGRRVKDG